MNDKYFLDTNILIYSIGNIIPKKTTAVNLIGRDAVISTQIVTESANVMSRKLKYGYPDSDNNSGFIRIKRFHGFKKIEE